MIKTADKIIVALDVPTKERALELVKQLEDKISFFIPYISKNRIIFQTSLMLQNLQNFCLELFLYPSSL